MKRRWWDWSFGVLVDVYDGRRKMAVTLDRMMGEGNR